MATAGASNKKEETPSADLICEVEDAVERQIDSHQQDSLRSVRGEHHGGGMVLAREIYRPAQPYITGEAVLRWRCDRYDARINKVIARWLKAVQLPILLAQESQTDAGIDTEQKWG